MGLKKLERIFWEDGGFKFKKNDKDFIEVKSIGDPVNIFMKFGDTISNEERVREFASIAQKYRNLDFDAYSQGEPFYRDNDNLLGYPTQFYKIHH